MGVYAMHMDVANRAASIPGTGDDPIAFTYSYDLAKFVGAMLALEKWETKMYCYSDRRTYNQVLAAAEEARGMSVLQVTLLTSRVQVRSGI